MEFNLKYTHLIPPFLENSVTIGIQALVIQSYHKWLSRSFQIISVFEQETIKKRFFRNYRTVQPFPIFSHPITSRGTDSSAVMCGPVRVTHQGKAQLTSYWISLGIGICKNYLEYNEVFVRFDTIVKVDHIWRHLEALLTVTSKWIYSIDQIVFNLSSLQTAALSSSLCDL